MSRIDKGGTKFKPMMRRGQNDRASEKPRSSTAPRSKPAEPSVPTDTSGMDLLAAASTSVLESPENAQRIPSHSNETTTSVASQTVPVPPVVRPSGSTLLMPSREFTRGNAISMPIGQRLAKPTRVNRTPEQNRPGPRTDRQPISETPVVTEVSPSLANVDPAPHTEGRRANASKRKGRKRKTVDEAQSQDPEEDAESAEPAKKKRKSASAPSGGKRTTRASRAAITENDGGEQEPEEGRPKRRRGRPAVQEEDEVNDEEEDERPTRRNRKARPHIDKPVNAVPEEVIPVDETTMTMKDLCNGMGQGRVSGRFLEVFIESNEATKQKRGDNLRLKELTRRKELGLPMDDDEANALSARGRRAAALPQIPSREQDNADAPNVLQGRNVEGDEEDEDYAGVAVTARAPKVRYDANGNLVLDETALQFDRQAEADEEQAARGPMEVIVETDRGRFTNHASYARKPRVDRWSKDETEQFYMGLRMFHTGFELIARTLPNRNRTMVRNKFKAEDRKNPEKVTHYLSSSMRLPYDLEFLSRETGRDFSGPIPQVQLPVAMIQNEDDAEENEKNDESIKQRLSTAPPSGGESDREGTSVSATANPRGRSTAKGKGKRKSSKSSNPSRPPSVPPRSTSVATVTGSHAESSNAPEREKESGPRPPRIGIANVTQRLPNPGSGVQMNRTTLSVTGGRNMLVLPGGGREFRRND